MRIIKAQTIAGLAEKFTDARKPLLDWTHLTQLASWESINDVRKIYPHADAVKVLSGCNVIVFNIKGGKYRLVVAIHLNRGKVFVLRFMTHAQYSKDKWKEQL